LLPGSVLAGLLACGPRTPEVPEPAAIQVATADPGPARPPPRRRREVQRLGADVYEVPSSLFRRILRERGAVDRRVWAEAATEDGKIVGYRLQGIRSESILAQLGLRDDDLIELINGSLPDSTEAIDGAQASAERTGRVTVLLTRLGYSRLLQYQLGED
jgi:type II secretory pathway component PulC